MDKEKNQVTGTAVDPATAADAENKDAAKYYRFFSHRACEYFPCHPTERPEEFNCLFCYCPLYALGEDCGGNFTYTREGIKDCSGCFLPHGPGGYDYIQEKFARIIELMKK